MPRLTVVKTKLKYKKKYNNTERYKQRYNKNIETRIHDTKVAYK